MHHCRRPKPSRVQWGLAEAWWMAEAVAEAEAEAEVEVEALA